MNGLATALHRRKLLDMQFYNPLKKLQPHVIRKIKLAAEPDLFDGVAVDDQPLRVSKRLLDAVLSDRPEGELLEPTFQFRGRLLVGPRGCVAAGEHVEDLGPFQCVDRFEPSTAVRHDLADQATDCERTPPHGLAALTR